MSLLAPLYALGILAVTLPLVFHLIRRSPRGELAFSSLMFLSPSPPRLAKRSRLEHLILLSLRGLAIALLAVAFARPFVRQEVLPVAEEPAASRILIMVDTSASMRRTGLWEQALRQIGDVLEDLRPNDEVAVLLCDDNVTSVVSFEEMARLEPGNRASFVMQRLAATKPGWGGSRLGDGLIRAVDVINETRETEGRAEKVSRRVVLVSDIQEGGRFSVLADYPWPRDVLLELSAVETERTTNAGLHLVAAAERAAEGVASQRIRVSNDASSRRQRFHVAWQEGGQAVGEAVEVYVPVGQSRIVEVDYPAQEQDVRRKKGRGDSVLLRELVLQLTGDDHDFDNKLHVVKGKVTNRTVTYVGTDDADDTNGLRYYLQRALEEGVSPPVRLEPVDLLEKVQIDVHERTPLVIVNGAPREIKGKLKSYVERGGTLLYVLTEGSDRAPEAAVEDHVMLGKIDFAHPLFRPMAGANFNDFTQIHFWKYRRFQTEQLGEGSRAIARFENGDAALVERRLGRGQVYVLTSGWHPSDSQFARSWKFVLLCGALVDIGQSNPFERQYYTIHEIVPLGNLKSHSGKLTITKPDGRKLNVAEGGTTFTADEPGIYSLDTSEGALTFAVNLDALESKTSAIGHAAIENLGFRFAWRDWVKPEEGVAERTAIELESRQKMWQWLIVTVLVVLVLETWLAGRASQQIMEGGIAA